SVYCYDDEWYTLEDVEFYVSGPGLPSGWNYVGSDYIGSDSGYASIVWTPPSAGTYTVMAEVQNEWGEWSWNNPTDSFSVSNQAPTVSVSAPSSVAAGSTVSVTVNGSDPNG